MIVTIELGTVAPFIKDLLNIDDDPPGIAIAAMALIDIQLIFATVLYGLGVILPHPTIGRLQGIASLILSISVDPGVDRRDLRRSRCCCS